MEQVIVPMSTGLVSPPGQERAARPLQTFDATNRDVVPPRVRYPQSLDLLPLGARTEAVAIEVVVNEGGTVEGAKVVRPPVTLGEYSSVMNGLSVAKTWRFQPATFNGQPVKYRLLISLTGR
jgi:hypothetical protein